MTVRMLARTMGIASVVWCAALFPQEAAAQCAVSWSDTAVSGSDVTTEGLVEDYYGSEPCGGFGTWFFHEYTVRIAIECGTQYGEEEVTSTVEYGGGSARAGKTVTATESTVCNVEVYLLIWCSALYAPIYEDL